MTPPFYGLVQSAKEDYVKPSSDIWNDFSKVGITKTQADGPRVTNALQWLPYGRKKIIGPQIHRRHVRRHILVDFLISAGGSLFAIAAIQKLIWAGVLAIVCLFGGLLFDYRNIEDEEHEIEEAVHEGERSVKSN